MKFIYIYIYIYIYIERERERETDGHLIIFSYLGAVNQIQRYLAVRIGGVTRLEIFENTTTALKGKRHFGFRNTRGISELVKWLIASHEGSYSSSFFHLRDRKRMICHNNNKLIWRSGDRES
jgi:hypothetical protein